MRQNVKIAVAAVAALATSAAIAEERTDGRPAFGTSLITVREWRAGAKLQRPTELRPEGLDRPLRRALPEQPEGRARDPQR